MNSDNFTTLLKAFQHGRGGQNIAIVIDGGISESVEQLLVRKGFCPTGGREKAPFTVIYGPLVHHLAPSMGPMDVIMMYAPVGARPLNVSERFLYNNAVELTDHPQDGEARIMADAIYAEMRKADAKRKSRSATKNGKRDEHSNKFHLDVRLPDGTKFDITLCVHCAIEFIKGNDDYAELFMRPELVRALLVSTLKDAFNAYEDEVDARQSRTVK